MLGKTKKQEIFILRYGLIDRVESLEIAEEVSELSGADRYVDRSFVEAVAHQLISDRCGVETEYKTEKTYHDDARTTLFESLTASGHLSTVETTGTLEEIHRTMLSVLLNSYNDELPEFERQRRFQEICEELTIQSVECQVAWGLLPPETQVATISDIPSSRGVTDNLLTNLGYRLQNKKGMVRSNRLINHGNGVFSRVSEQVSRSNSSAHNSRAFLYDNGVQPIDASNVDACVIGTQVVHMSQGVASIMRRLDRYQGANIRYGEEENQSQISYDRLSEESAERERQAEFYIDELSNYMRHIDNKLGAGEINVTEHQELLKTEIHRILQAICVLRPEYTVDCFGAESKSVYEFAADLALGGNIAGAADYVSNNKHKESIITFCGMSISTDKIAKDNNISPSSLEALIRLGLENWPTKIGKCRVPECVSPKPTEVGGCDVCTGGCEPLFKRGWSLNKIVDYYRSMRNSSKKIVRKSVTIWDFFKSDKQKQKSMRR